MEISKIKDLNLLMNKTKYIFLYIHDTWCSDITLQIDNFFKDKYDLNKNYIKIQVSKKPSLIKKLDITFYPIIKIYHNNEIISELSCNTLNFIENLEKLYNFFK